MFCLNNAPVHFINKDAKLVIDVTCPFGILDIPP